MVNIKKKYKDNFKIHIVRYFVSTLKKTNPWIPFSLTHFGVSITQNLCQHDPEIGHKI